MVTNDHQIGLAVMDETRRDTVFRVALVDTDRVDRVVTHHILSRRGHEVTVLHSANELIEHASDGPFDVLVLSGDEQILDRIDLESCHRWSRAIVLITNASIDDDLAQGCNVVLPRPVGSRELLAAVAIAGRGRRSTVIHR